MQLPGQQQPRALTLGCATLRCGVLLRVGGLCSDRRLRQDKAAAGFPGRRSSPGQTWTQWKQCPPAGHPPAAGCCARRGCCGAAPLLPTRSSAGGGLRDRRPLRCAPLPSERLWSRRSTLSVWSLLLRGPQRCPRRCPLSSAAPSVLAAMVLRRMLLTRIGERCYLAIRGVQGQGVLCTGTAAPRSWYRAKQEQRRRQCSRQGAVASGRGHGVTNRVKCGKKVAVTRLVRVHGEGTEAGMHHRHCRHEGNHEAR